jgi:hypothetical protein
MGGAAAPCSRHSKVINDAVNDAEGVLPTDGFGRIVKIGMQVVHADSIRERRGEAIFGASSERPGGIVYVPSAESAGSIWKGTVNLCAAEERVNISGYPVPVRREKHGTSKVAKHVRTMSASQDVHGPRVANI